MLTKQAWRFLTTPSTLITRVFKAKYFRDTSLFGARPVNAPSFAWRSIMRGVEVLRLGCRCHIGPGTQTSICHSPWLPSDASFYVRNPDDIHAHLSRVLDLIDADIGWWREDILSTHFHVQDAALIRKIQLRRQGPADKWCWHYNRTGQFSVCSAYHLIVESPRSAMHHRLPTVKENGSFWNKLWSYKIPQRVKHFAYCFSTDSLPKIENLRKRTMDVASDCPLCGEDGNTTCHLFLECPYAKAVWRTAGLLHTVEKNRKNRGESWLQQVLETTIGNVAGLSLMSCDGIWFQRNREIFEGRHMDSDLTTTFVISSLCNYRDVNGWPERESLELHDHALARPPKDGVKLFFDAGLGLDATGIGVVVLGNDGEFLGAREKRYVGITDAALAEGMALETAILLAKEMKVDQPVFIGDALGVVRMVRGDETAPLTCIGQVARIHRLLVMNDFSPPFWTHRDNNLLAHSLVAHAKAGSLVARDWTSIPLFFLSLDTGRSPVV